MRAAKARSNSGGRQEFRVRTLPLSAHLWGARVRAIAASLETALTDHDAVLVDADDVIVAGHARVISPKALRAAVHKSCLRWEGKSSRSGRSGREKVRC